MRKSEKPLFANAISLLICGVLAGVVVAAAAFPLVALSGLAAKAGGEAFGQLPDELTVKRTPQISYIYASDNKTLVATMFDENRRDLKLAEIPKIMQQAMIAAEDQKFYQHNGVDVKGFARAFIANKTSGEVEQGASTITMQLVRMTLTFTSSPQDVITATEDTSARKLREVRYAIALERKMTKDQILESYMNTAYFGLRAYGVFAASQVYFNKTPQDLTLSQTAFLVGLVKFPGDTNKPGGKERAVSRRDYVLNNLVGMGVITAEQAAAAKAEPVEIIGNETANGCTGTTNPTWGFYCDFFQRWWLQQQVFGATNYDRERQLRSGGYRIVSTLDVHTQNGMYDALIKARSVNDPNALMLAAIEPGDGKVRGLAVNRNFRLDDKNNPQNGPHTNPIARAQGIRGSYPNTTNPLLSTDPDFQGYRPGSVMKIFTMTAALENGFPLDYTINTQDRAVSKYRYTGDPNCGGYWCPPNNTGTPTGPQNMWTAFGASINTYFVPLFDAVGGLKVMDTARRMGLTFYNDPNRPNDNDYTSSTNPRTANVWSPFTLGISTHPPLEIANAFATLAADGLFCEPTPIEMIINQKGEKLDAGGPRCRQAVNEDVARAAIDAARCPVGDKSFFNPCPYATARTSYGIIKHPIAGKTGTSDKKRTATLTITTKQLAMSGFLADPDWPDTTTEMPHAGANGVNIAVQNAMAEAMKDLPPIQFTRPSDKMAFGNQVPIPDVTCKSISEAQAILKGAGFKPDVASAAPVPSPCPPGTAAGTNPTGKTVAGGPVVIQVSAGGGGPGGGGGGPKPSPTKKPPFPVCPPFCPPNVGAAFEDW
jgi:membrane peptidoglycan carboxypeptidase